MRDSRGQRNTNETGETFQINGSSNSEPMIEYEGQLKTAETAGTSEPYAHKYERHQGA